MKRLFLSIVLVLCAFMAQSQIFVSLNAGGYISSGNTTTLTQITVTDDTTYSADVPNVGTTSFEGGFRFGYKTGKLMFGIGANYTMTTVKNQPLDPSLIPICPETMWITKGTMDTKSTTITVVPFFRYDIVKAGDISLFAELNAFYAMEQNPTVTAHQTYIKDGVPTPLRDFDTTFTQTRNATGFGARITPGLNWMLTPNVSIDLYLDFLSIAYASYTRTSEYYQFTIKPTSIGTDFVVSKEETLTTTVTEKNSDIDLGIFGTPNWGSSNPGNFVRVGLNICF